MMFDSKQNGLRRRNSRSPEPRGALGTAAKSTTGRPASHVSSKYKPSTLAKLSVPKKILLVSAAIPCFGLLVFTGYWWSLYFGVVDPRHYSYQMQDECPVAQWSYPWCGPHLHHNPQAGQLSPPLSSDKWLVLRQRYQDAIATTNSRSSLAPDWSVANTTGFVLPIDIQVFPNRGRGVVTMVPLKQGQKVWDNRYRAVFPSGQQDGDCAARIFFSQLDNQQACDAMFWGYVNNFYGNGFQYMLDLDGHGYINHGDAGVDRNVVHHFQDEIETDQYALSRLMTKLSPSQWAARNEPGAYGLYAARDIAAGEEILYDYNEIFMYGMFDWYTFFVCHSLPFSEWFTI